jgi:hypothetical protein
VPIQVEQKMTGVGNKTELTEILPKKTRKQFKKSV